MSEIKPLLIALAISSLIGVAAWVFIQLMLTPQQRFIDECSETYLLTDCMERWERLHPMPADYGEEP